MINLFTEKLISIVEIYSTEFKNPGELKRFIRMIDVKNKTELQKVKTYGKLTGFHKEWVKFVDLVNKNL